MKQLEDKLQQMVCEHEYITWNLLRGGIVSVHDKERLKTLKASIPYLMKLLNELR
jgi:hypothetical protein